MALVQSSDLNDSGVMRGMFTIVRHDGEEEDDTEVLLESAEGFDTEHVNMYVSLDDGFATVRVSISDDEINDDETYQIQLSGWMTEVPIKPELTRP